MEKLKIILCGTNETELDGYAAICRGICEKADVPADLLLYANSSDLLFDMNDHSFSASVGIFIVDPENGFETAPAAVRKAGYDGLLFYLSHSSSPAHYRQAFDVGSLNFVQKGTDHKELSRFYDVFNQALQSVKQLKRQYLAVSNVGEYRNIKIEDIYYFETARNHMIRVVYKGGSFEFISTLQKLEESFCDYGFVRVHRSYLVSVDSIHRVETDILTLNNESTIPVSRNNAATLKAAILYR